MTDTDALNKALEWEIAYYENCLKNIRKSISQTRYLEQQHQLIIQDYHASTHLLETLINHQNLLIDILKKLYSEKLNNS